MPSERIELDRTPLDELVAETAEQKRCHTISWGVVRDGELALTGSSGPFEADTDAHDVDRARRVYRISSVPND